MRNQININNLINSKNQLVINFLKQKSIKKLIHNYEDNPKDSTSYMIVNELRNYFLYVMMLDNLKRNIYFKNQHIMSRNNNSKKNYYVTNEILDTNESRKLFEIQNNWEDIINNASLLGSIKKLNIKSQKILWFLIVDQITQKEIAMLLNTSQQSISKSRKLILRKLRIELVRIMKNEKQSIINERCKSER